MILYSDDTSPYCAPVRAAIYAKGLGLAIEPPPGGIKSAEYKALSVTGTIPALKLDDGSVLPESAVILGYLDEKFPENPLRPADAEGRARVALVQRLTEQGVLGPLVQLFHDFSAGLGDAARDKAREALTVGLTRLEAVVAADGYACGPDFTLADCILAPALFGVIAWAPGLGDPELLTRHHRLIGYFPRAAAHPAIAKVLGELQTALAASGVSLG